MRLVLLTVFYSQRGWYSKELRDFPKMTRKICPVWKTLVRVSGKANYKLGNNWNFLCFHILQTFNKSLMARKKKNHFGSQVQWRSIYCPLLFCSVLVLVIELHSKVVKYFYIRQAYEDINATSNISCLFFFFVIGVIADTKLAKINYNEISKEQLACNKDGT